MAAIVIESAGAPTQNGNVALKALEQFSKSGNFAAGTVQVLIIPKLFQRFFFVVIMKVLMKNKLTVSVGRLP